LRISRFYHSLYNEPSNPEEHPACRRNNDRGNPAITLQSIAFKADMSRISDAAAIARAAILTCGSRFGKVVTRGIRRLSAALSRVEAEGE